MNQNTSSAVMAQRKEPHDSLDFFPTPPWATRAICEMLPIDGHLAWDPVCGDGHMSRPLQEYALAVASSDVHDYGWGHEVHDFLQPYTPYGIAETEWAFFNPPFRLAEKIIIRAFEVATHGVCVLVRTAFLEGTGRYERLFKPHPPAFIAQFSERVIMHKGILRDPSKPYWDKKRKQMIKPSTATSYCWVIWIKEHDEPTRLVWIPPCRKKLERPGDYDQIGELPHHHAANGTTEQIESGA